MRVVSALDLTDGRLTRWDYGSPDEYKKYSGDNGEEAEDGVGGVRGRGVLVVLGSDGEDGEVQSDVDARGEAA